MNSSNALSRSTYFLLFVINLFVATSFAKINYKSGDFEYSCSGTFKPEQFFGKNVSLLNNTLPEDKIWYARHTLDFVFDIAYGQETYGYQVAKAKFDIRDKAVWGNTLSIIPTTDTDIKLLNSVTGTHKHQIPRHLFWMREAWLDISLNEILGLGFSGEHRLRLGAFPFQLGRGISLGSAFAVGPGLLGFYNDSSVEQFAFGGKIGGELLRDNVLNYDFYVAILQNKSGSLSDTAANIRGQQFGRRESPQRGFGVINYIAATRLMWTPFNTDTFGKLTFEPYALYNSDPEQKIEFTADASSKLGTLGLACEFESDKASFGFDYALNVGRQRVRGLDRNHIELENRDGDVVEVNSHVRVDSVTGDKALFTGSATTEQKAIDSAPQGEVFNGKLIADIHPGLGELFNANNRFRNPFKNIYKGWMFVIDGDIFLYKKDLKGALAAGIATGDDNPNEETIDGDFTGFIGLQEIYSGKRVRSAFLLGGAGKLKRPLATPTLNQSTSRFPSSLSGFTNLVFAGTALNWEPQDWEKGFKLNPNALIYWQDKPTKKFDITTQKDGKENASTFLGVETNVFLEYKVLKDMTFFLVASIFFPGQHYVDIKGKPLTSSQLKALNEFNNNNAQDAEVPNIGSDTAFTFNTGFTFKF